MHQLHPHKSEYWENPDIEDWAIFKENVTYLCDLLSKATDLAKEGVHLVSVDEKTGMQALERAKDTLPMKEGKTEKRECNYIRHGTKVLIANYLPATGKVLSSSVTDTRTEADFLAHIQQTVNTEPNSKWIFIADNLNTHYSASLVKWVARQINDKQELGEKRKKGILKDKSSRKIYLSNPEHNIQFVYTPKHCSWLNPVENWFAILQKRVLNRGNFESVEQLEQKIIQYIEYHNQWWANVFKWSIDSAQKIKILINKIKAIYDLS